MDTEMVVALVFKLHGSDEHPLPDPVEWSRDTDNIGDYLNGENRQLIGQAPMLLRQIVAKIDHFVIVDEEVPI